MTIGVSWVAYANQGACNCIADATVESVRRAVGIAQVLWQCTALTI